MVLEMLAGATNGCPEELLLANGFTYVRAAPSSLAAEHSAHAP